MSAEYWKRQEIGAQLSAIMPKRYTLNEVAGMIGISKDWVRRIEREALWKVWVRMREF